MVLNTLPPHSCDFKLIENIPDTYLNKILTWVWRNKEITPNEQERRALNLLRYTHEDRDLEEIFEDEKPLARGNPGLRLVQGWSWGQKTPNHWDRLHHPMVDTLLRYMLTRWPRPACMTNFSSTLAPMYVNEICGIAAAIGAGRDELLWLHGEVVGGLCRPRANALQTLEESTGYLMRNEWPYLEPEFEGRCPMFSIAKQTTPASFFRAAFLALYWYDNVEGSRNDTDTIAPVRRMKRIIDNHIIPALDPIGAEVDPFFGGAARLETSMRIMERTDTLTTIAPGMITLDTWTDPDANAEIEQQTAVVRHYKTLHLGKSTVALVTEAKVQFGVLELRKDNQMMVRKFMVDRLKELDHYSQSQRKKILADAVPAFFIPDRDEIEGNLLLSTAVAVQNRVAYDATYHTLGFRERHWWKRNFFYRLFHGPTRGLRFAST